MYALFQLTLPYKKESLGKITTQAGRTEFFPRIAEKTIRESYRLTLANTVAVASNPLCYSLQFLLTVDLRIGSSILKTTHECKSSVKCLTSQNSYNILIY